MRRPRNQDLAIALTGTTDRIRRVGDGFGIGDLKTGKTAVRADGHVETAGHAMQMGVYELMAERASGLPITEPALIIGMQTGKTERGQRVGDRPRSSARATCWSASPIRPACSRSPRTMIHTGTFPGNPARMLCSRSIAPHIQPAASASNP
jgi:hypothetical protein